MRTLALIALLVPASLAHAQPATDSLQAVVEDIRAAIDRGDVETLVGYVGERMEVGLFGAARLYSHGQAEHVLERFFREYPPGRLVLGEAVETSLAWFAAGQYYRSDGRSPLRVYLRLRRVSGGWLLREMVVLEATQ